MSLLLDALKKAAEQKAEKDGGSGPDGAVSAESRVSEETRTELPLDTDLSLDPPEVESPVIERAPEDIINVDSEVVTDLGEETIMGIFDEDQTMVLTDDDVTNFMGDEEPSVLEAENKASDEDLSLYLIDQESSEGSPDDGPKTGSLAASTQVQLLAESQAETNRLNIDDFPEQNLDDDEDHTVVLRADQTMTTGVNLDGLTRTGKPGLQEQTSTRTYAPDNYDRTLARTENEDASNLFAGMKSDSGVVMTPEYAKKVFVSKFSTQRMYQYRIFSAVGFGILLVIGLLGMIELQQESLDIDAKLRPLKRDPMPGVINTASNQEASSTLFIEDQPVVDNLTLQLVEDAEMQSDSRLILGQEVEVEQNPEPEPEIAEVQPVENEVKTDDEPAMQPVLATAQPATEINAGANTSELDEAPKQQLQIITGKTISNKDRWLREAYAAYQRGDDEAAMEKYAQVLEVDASNRNALLARAAIYIQNGYVGAAIRDYQTLLLANPKDSLAMASLIAVANYSPHVAESQLKIMIHDEPDSAYLNFALANVYGAQNRWIEAQGLYFIALENNPKDPNYAYNLAVSLEHIEKPEVAIAYYERALDNINNGLATFNRDVVDQRLEKLKQL